MYRSNKLIAIAALLFCAITSKPAFSQGLNWEGQTGAFITPFAYTSKSPAGSLGRPELSFHFLNGGTAAGNDFQLSITEGAFQRVEFGYTRALNLQGDSAALSPLFTGGFNIFHGKVNLVKENAWKKKYMPAISTGFVARTQVHRVGAVLTGKDTSNEDFYVVATKTITQIKGLPVVVNFGGKGTDGSLLGIAGNAPDWSTCLFGSGALVFKGPSKTTLILGSEFAQQPHHIQDVPNATLPTSLAYFARVVPKLEGAPLQLDFGVAQVAGRILPGVDLGARARVATGVSYRF